MFRFVANLKPYTLDEHDRESHFAAYLLSIDYARGARHLIDRLHEERRVLAADNGNFDRIGKHLARLTSAAEPLAARRKSEEAVLRHYARPGELSTTIRNLYTSLAKQASAEAKAAHREDNVLSVVAAQLALLPSYLIGMEDFTMPLLIGLGVERAYAKLPMSFFEKAADRAIKYARDTEKGVYGPCNAAVFAGLHAMDFDTAQAIGKRAGKAKVSGIAVGLGSALDDRAFTDYRVEGRRVVKLGASLPRPYIRALEIAAGVHLGFAHATGRRPRFHALGAGTPILLPLLAVLGDRGTYTATDSTAPIKDGYSSATIALYTDRPAPLKLKSHLIVQYWLDGGFPWDCPCPHCTTFMKKHPCRLRKAKAWWIGEAKRPLTPSDLWAPSPLAEHVPFFGMARSPAIRRSAGLSRVAHNHWVLRRIEASINRRSRSGSELRDWAESIVEKYAGSNAGPAWKGATLAAWTIASAAGKKLEMAESGGVVHAL